jgi:hypothetical protein
MDPLASKRGEQALCLQVLVASCAAEEYVPVRLSLLTGAQRLTSNWRSSFLSTSVLFVVS